MCFTTRVTTDEPRTTPLYWIAAGLLAGQAAAVALGSGWRWVVAAAALAALAGAFRRRWRILFLTGAAALFAAAFGHWQLDRVLRPDLPPEHVGVLDGTRVVLRGRVAARPQRLPGKTRLLLDAAAARRGAEWAAARGLVLLTLRAAEQPWRRGDELEGIVALRRPRNFGNPGEADFVGRLARRGVYVTAFAASDRGWRRTATAGGSGVFERWREETALAIGETLGPAVAPIAAALLVGDAIPLPVEVRERYARAGVSHVLSISGLHVGLVAAGAYVLLRWLLARSERLLLRASVPKLALALGLVPVALYAAIAGDNVATIRAEAMGMLAVAAVLLDRPRDWLAALAAAALAICLARPGALCEISFQLSFVAVAAVIVGGRRAGAWWRAREEADLLRLRGRIWRGLRWIFLTEAVGAAALLGTAPLTAWHFNQVSLIAPIANPLVVPLLGGACVGIGLAATAVLPFAPALAAIGFRVVGVLVVAADALVGFLAAVPGASVRVVTPSPIELALIYGALGGLLLPAGGWRRSVLALSLAGLALDAAWWAAERAAREELRITFASVGQGDCAVVEFPNGEVMVVDGGGLSADFDVGRLVVAPFLWRRKIARADTLVLSHADFDHRGGLAFIAAEFAPKAFWWNGFAAGAGADMAALWKALGGGAVDSKVLGDGFRRRIGGVEVRVLHPPAGYAGTENDRSLTLQLRYGQRAVLLPGDLEAAGESALVAAHGDELRSDILKVPHHGSRTSSTAALLDAVAPRVAIASLGAANRFGFPHPGVLDAYRRRGIALWRTDRDGAVTIRIRPSGAIDVTAANPRLPPAEFLPTRSGEPTPSPR